MSDDGARIYDPDGTDAALDQDAEKDAELRREQRRVALLRLLNDIALRDWVWLLLQELGTFGTNFAAGPTGFPDPMATAYYQGRHSAGWRVWTELDDIAPDLCSLMRREHQ